MDIASLLQLYRSGHTSPSAHISEIFKRIAHEGLQPVWISLVDEAVASHRARTLELDPEAIKLPLYGVPFAVKDNIDVAGMPTTAGCPAFAYIPETSATIVEKLENAGAILIGKTNMDQFATGLVGTRSPYGICSSVFDDKMISGGSSSGSALAVAKGLVSFALGTDTAGSGRVPAAFNQLVGLKPTRGLISTAGVVPACRTLDCVSIFAETSADASTVFASAKGEDPGDSYSRTAPRGCGATPWLSTADPERGTLNPFRVGIPQEGQLEFFGDADSAAAFARAVKTVVELGAEIIEIDYTPFREAAELLYAGPWVAERLAAILTFHETSASQMDPTVQAIISGGGRFSAIDAFASTYKLQSLRKQTEPVWKSIDVMLLPTAPRSYSIEEVMSDPVSRNTKLGYYTNFVNLLDLAAFAVPAGFASERQPFGISLIGPAWSDDGLLLLGDRLHRRLATTLGGSKRPLDSTSALTMPPVPPGCLLMAVVGAHLSGEPLNWQLTGRNGRLVRKTRTSPEYRFYALANTTPPKPGLVCEPGFKGPGIELEIWALPSDSVGSFVDAVPPPLTIGNVRLQDGEMVKGFLAEPYGLGGATEITHFGGWRSYLTSRK